MTRHIEAGVSLYVLGCLTEVERRAIDGHAAGCTQCSQALCEAREQLSALEVSYPSREAPLELESRITAMLEGAAATPLLTSANLRRWYGVVGALAAVIVLAFLPTTYLWQQNRAMRAGMLADSAMISRIITSPHRTAAFGSPANAYVMYGKDGSWYCIIVRGAYKPVDIGWKHDGRMTVLGRAEPHGEIAMLYLPKSHRMHDLALLEQSRVLSEARLVF